MSAVESSNGSLALPSDLISIGEVARLLGVSTQSVRNYGADGILQVYRFGVSHRRFSRREVMEYAHGTSVEAENEKVLTYARVSTYAQGKGRDKEKKDDKGDLGRQIKRLHDYAKENYPGHEIVSFSDIGSGMNFLRRGLGVMIDRILAGDFDGTTLLVHDRDRLSRFGYEIIEKVCASHGLKVVYIAQQEIDDENLLVADLLAITTIYSARLYGNRVGERMKKKLSPELIARGLELWKAGHSILKTAAILNQEGYRYSDGGLIGYEMVRKHIYLSRTKLEKVLPDKPSTVKEWWADCVIETTEEHVVQVNHAYDHYVKWAKRKKKTLVSKRRFINENSQKSAQVFSRTEGTTRRVWRGMKIKGESLHYIKPLIDRSGMTPTDIVLKFAKQLGRWNGHQLDLFRKYQTYCKNIGQKPACRATMVAVLKSIGWKKIREGQKVWFVKPRRWR